MVEARGIHAISPISHSARHAGHADSPDSLAPTGARLWHCAEAGADLEIRGSGEPRFPLSRSSQAGTERLVEGRVEGIGNRPRGQVLFIDSFGTKTARARKG